ncbi:MAG: 3-deoxy-D-manno-octulosonic acid transferase [Bacteroidetes bacterium]|nr:3-deoxy-D-manno-octulosonic acid transferase [Bacteroidota bacterium]
MRLIYDLGLVIYRMSIRIASIFNDKARLWLKGRENLFANILKQVNPQEKIAWFHCASLGEFEQGRPVIEAFRKQNPECKILLTFFSPSGYEIRKNYNGADYIFYLPMDSKRNAEKFIEFINPSVVVFIKYEFWYHYIQTLNNKNIPVYLISANFRSTQIFFKRYGGFFRNLLKFFTYIFVQTSSSKDLLSTIGLNNISVAGDTRFDRVYSIVKQANRLPVVEKFKQNKTTIIVGSSWKEDEEILIPCLNQTFHDVKWIIAPHEIHEENLSRIIRNINKRIVRYSEMSRENASDFDVLLIDNIGMLSSLYYYGDIAYIGGGFGKGIHNILEAATFGIPVIFGPNFKKFHEAVELINQEGAFSIRSFEELMNTLDTLLQNQELLDTAGKIAKKFIENSLGATNIIVEKLVTKKS